MTKIDINLNDKYSLQEAVNILIHNTKKILDEVSYEKPLNSFVLASILCEGKDISFEQMNTKIISSVMACEGFNVEDVFKEKINENMFNTQAIYSQCFLVLKALEFGFEKEVEELAKVIIAFSHKQNESDRMWYNYYNVYGFDLLRTMSEYDEKYFYLLYSFVTPNWDEEHDTRINEYLHLDMTNITRAKLKALAYGSNYHALRCNFIAYDENYEMIIDDTLASYFKENPNELIYLKEEILNSLKQTPRNEYMELREYIDDSYDEVFEERIKEVLSSFPLSDFPFEEEDEEEDEENNDAYFTDEEYEILGDYEGFDEEENEETIFINKEFFLKGFSFGEEIINYVQTGQNEEVLQKIKKVENLIEFAKEKNLSIVKRFIYNGYDLYDIFDAFMYEQNTIIKNEEDEKQRVLRVLNVLLRIRGQKMVSEHVRHYTKKYKLCSFEEFYALNSEFIHKEDFE